MLNSSFLRLLGDAVKIVLKGRDASERDIFINRQCAFHSSKDHIQWITLPILLYEMKTTC